jgi:hypothetical protein
VIRRASQPLSQGDHNLRPVPIVEEVMHVCHHAASLDFAVAREGCARLRRGPLLIARSLSRVGKQTGRKPGNFNLDEAESEIYRSKPVS